MAFDIRTPALSRRALLLGSALSLLPLRAVANGLKSDEEVLFIPSYARELPSGEVEITIEAWVFEFERRRGARSAFLTLLDVDADSMTPETSAIFAERSRWFLSDSERGKELEISFDDGAAPVTLSPTNRSGRVTARVLRESAGASPVHFHTKRGGDGLVFRGLAHLVAETGLSIVSDIDDTIKISNVADTRTLLRDSLMKPFEPAPGMAALYQRLAQTKGVSFHYLSSSPIQLLPSLLAFLEAEGFPRGSLHLRESTAWNSLIPGDGDSFAHKHAVLSRLLADFPRRQFLLIGDSGEADPEIYGQIARDNPGRDIPIMIREAAGSPATRERFEAAFAGLSPDSWSVFTDAPKDLPPLAWRLKAPPLSSD